MRFLILFLVSLFFFTSCKEDKGISRSLPPINTKKETSNTQYAKGFSITKNEMYSVLQINNPWPKAEKSFRYVLISQENAAKTSFMKGEYDGIIIQPIQKIVVTSTTHIPALELLGVEQYLIGFPGTEFISSKKIRNRIDNGYVRNLGKGENLNTEVILELKPDAVIGFGIDGGNRSYETIKKSGIPIIYNGDWVESSPLAKAEWIKFFGALFNKEKQADSIFSTIEKNYLDTRLLAKNVKTKPTILSGAMHKDIWYLPNGTSTEAQLLKDANTNYLWGDDKGVGSLKLNFESVFVKAKNADIWFSPSNYSNLKNLKNGNEQHTMFKAFQNKNIYSFVNTTGESGGVLYYELGMTRPDIVLKDLIKICHPELLKNYKPYFFKPLE